MRILLTGASGQLGAYLIDALVAAGHEIVAWSGSDAGQRSGISLLPVDLTDWERTGRMLKEVDPEAILHAAAISTAEAVRIDPLRAQLVNVEATRRLAGWCAARDRRMIFTSTDMVFDGSKAWSREDDPASPITGYGRSKRAAEPFVADLPRGLVVRVSLLFGPGRSGRDSYFDRSLAAIAAGSPQTFFEDEFRTPLHLADAARVVARLVGDDAAGILHVGGTERISRHGLMSRIATALGLDPSLVGANRRADLVGHEPRPADLSLDTSRLASLYPDWRRPTIEEAAARGVAGRE